MSWAYTYVWKSWRVSEIKRQKMNFGTDGDI